jgi:hypothetical protein
MKKKISKLTSKEKVTLLILSIVLITPFFAPPFGGKQFDIADKVMYQIVGQGCNRSDESCGLGMLPFDLLGYLLFLLMSIACTYLVLQVVIELIRWRK